MKVDYLSDNIKAYRRKCHLTQQALGVLCGVSAQAVSKWEKKLSYPDILMLPFLADLMGHSIDELLTVLIQFDT